MQHSLKKAPTGVRVYKYIAVQKLGVSKDFLKDVFQRTLFYSVLVTVYVLNVLIIAITVNGA